MEPTLAQQLQYLSDRLKKDQACGVSAVDSLMAQEEQLRAIMASPTFLTLLLTILPKALPLVITIFQELRSGKTFMEVIIAHISDIVEVVVAVVSALTQKADAPVTTPVSTPR